MTRRRRPIEAMNIELSEAETGLGRRLISTKSDLSETSSTSFETGRFVHFYVVSSDNKGREKGVLPLRFPLAVTFPQQRRDVVDVGGPSRSSAGCVRRKIVVVLSHPDWNPSRL